MHSQSFIKNKQTNKEKMKTVHCNVTEWYEIIHLSLRLYLVRSQDLYSAKQHLKSAAREGPIKHFLQTLQTTRAWWTLSDQQPQCLACLSMPVALSREWFIILIRCSSKERVSPESLPWEDLIRFLHWLKTFPAHTQNFKFGDKRQCILRQGYSSFCFKPPVPVFSFLEIAVYIT